MDVTLVIIIFIIHLVIFIFIIIIRHVRHHRRSHHDGIAGATSNPNLDLYRCTSYPREIADLIKRQAFDSGVRRDQPHWARRGPSETSWAGWVWSNGDGWFWTDKRGWFELIPRMGRASSSASTPQSRAGYVAPS